MKETTAIWEEILMEADDDWVSMEVVLGIVEERSSLPREVAMAVSTGVVAMLVLDGVMVLGELGDDGFVSWPLGQSESIVRLYAMFEVINPADRDTFFSEVWLDWTPAGRALSLSIAGNG